MGMSAQLDYQDWSMAIGYCFNSHIKCALVCIIDIDAIIYWEATRL